MDVQVEGVELVVRVRHKATVAPIFGLSTGKTLRDTSVTLGAIEHNIDKRATRLHGQVTYSERGFNFDVGFTQHPYDPHRWAQEYELYYAGSGFRFEDTTSTWVRNRFGAVAEVISPLSYRNRFQYELAFLPYYERNTPLPIRLHLQMAFISASWEKLSTTHTTGMISSRQGSVSCSSCVPAFLPATSCFAAKRASS